MWTFTPRKFVQIVCPKQESMSLSHCNTLNEKERETEKSQTRFTRRKVTARSLSYNNSTKTEENYFSLLLPKEHVRFNCV